MKRFTAESNRKARIFSTEAMPRTQEPFAENRYRKYRFQRESIVLHAPESSGVYGLFNALWIYIGESDNIRARLLEHLATENLCIFHHRPSGFAFELLSPGDRARRRQELINQLEPICRQEPSNIGPGRGAVSDRGVKSDEVTVLSVDPELCKIGK